VADIKEEKTDLQMAESCLVQLVVIIEEQVGLTAELAPHACGIRVVTLMHPYDEKPG
jgi:hypothetical protein